MHCAEEFHEEFGNLLRNPPNCKDIIRTFVASDGLFHPSFGLLPRNGATVEAIRLNLVKSEASAT
jgi:hypothetical protein